MIELGRYNEVSKDNRTCPICEFNQIQDETYFLFLLPQVLINNRRVFQENTVSVAQRIYYRS